jgi:DNA-binding HxlR family transcriptional regulator
MAQGRFERELAREVTAKRFTVTVRFPGGGGERTEYSLTELAAELGQLCTVLDAVAPRETITIERIA